MVGLCARSQESFPRGAMDHGLIISILLHKVLGGSVEGTDVGPGLVDMPADTICSAMLQALSQGQHD